MLKMVAKLERNSAIVIIIKNEKNFSFLKMFNCRCDVIKIVFIFHAFNLRITI